MSNDYVLAEAIQLIKSGKKDAARVMLERFLQRNPDSIQAWMWEAETFPNDTDKIKVLEACLRNNPGNAQATQALNFLKNRVAPPPPPPSKPASPFTASPFTDSSSSPPPFAAPPASAKKPLPFIDTPTASPLTSSTSPFTTTSPFHEDSAPEADQQNKKPLPGASPFETSQPEKPAAPEKKPARKSSGKTEIFIIVGVVAVFILLIGGYIGGGFYLNGQINTSFAAQQCKDVIQRGSFVALYPQGIFSSVFTGYDQYTQCTLKLELESAVEAKNWANALALAQQYVTLYPQGAFVTEMNEQSVSVLSNWAKELLANKNYSSGIEKSKQFIETYPDLPTNAAVRDDILQAYLDWTKEFIDAKDYSSAEQYLKEALAYFESDSARAPKIKEELVKVYISLGDAQVAIGNMDNAAKYYQQANDLSQGAADANLLIAKAYLQQALDIASKNDFNRALTKVADVEKTAQAENIKAEVNTARETILQKYSESNSMQATDQITAAIPLVCKGQIPELPIFGMDENAVRAALFTSVITPLPKELAAGTPGQLHYVACVSETEKEVQSCPYTIIGTGGRATMYRLRYDWTATLYEVMTGETISSQSFKGGDPPECKPKELFTKGVKQKKSYGSKPTADQVAEWLQGLGILK